jgi:hypothetical protein
MNPTDPKVIADRHPVARGLSVAQTRRLLDESTSVCEQCGDLALCYALHTAGFDPTTWALCDACHPNGAIRDLLLNESFAHFLRDPLAARYDEHMRLMHEPLTLADLAEIEETI